ncbi:MAG: NUDIX hydrolase [Acidobacteria bacterium]|nr:NUDIX hydrolase [Acidobacteriota bacterium]
MSDAFSIVARETLLRSYVFKVERRTVAHDGEEYTRDIAVHGGAVAMVAINEHDEVGLIRQYRATVDRILWEIPAGTIDASDTDPLSTAQRELLEEMGVRAAQWRPIATVYVSPGWTDQVMHIYEARDLVVEERSPEGPEESAAQVVWLSRARVRELLDGGEVNDATLTIGLRHYLEVDGRP